MSEKQNDISAFNQIIKALEKLDDEGKVRILESVKVFLGLKVGKGSTTDGDEVDELNDLSPKDFMKSKKPKTDIEKIACLAHYLAHSRNIAEFQTKDITQLNSDAGQGEFSNPTESTKNASKAGYLIPAGKKKRKLSAYGEDLVKAMPNEGEIQKVKELYKNTIKKKKRKKKGKKKK